MSNTKAPRVVLGKRPKDFAATVQGPMADGTIGEIKITFRYMMRTEWGALLDAHREARTERTEAALNAYLKSVDDARKNGQKLPQSPGAEAAQTAEVEADAKLVLDLATGWDLPDDFNFEAVCQLANESPGLITALVKTFGAAVHEGRLGN